ncbi:class C sortase [Enterococcus mediterraneensis]|uniref:class C sortase n=1 Tax=Enterococcus mediterraneensis TaxID=2364791 RepID=UPI001F14A745|nr:class C sortase [Enterococcus mediterraneensis]
MKKPRRGKKRIRFFDLIMILVLMLGIGVLAYPFLQDSLNDYLAQRLIANYQKEAAKENEQQQKKRQAEMNKKNQELAKKDSLPGISAFNEAVDASQVDSLKSDTFFEKHIIGTLVIPKISVDLPIFDQTTDIFLQKGTSLLEGSSYPTGGESTHAVLSGHRGLPEAKLFTDLPELENGDEFFIEINGKILAYQVSDKQVIEPTNTEPLRIQPGKDLVTLLTCTPYMINSHRLLVTGHRIPYTEKAAQKQIHHVDGQKKLKNLLWLIGTILAIMLVILGLIKYFRFLIIKQRRYPMDFVLKDPQGQPIADKLFYLRTANGKKAVTRDKVPLQCVSDSEGKVYFPDLRGGNYRLVSEDVVLRSSIRRAKDKRFTLKLKRTSNYQLKRLKTNYLLIQKNKN